MAPLFYNSKVMIGVSPVFLVIRDEEKMLFHQTVLLIMRNTGLTSKDTHPLNNVCLACKKDRKAFCHLPIIDGVKGSDWKWVKGFLCPPPTTINTITTIPPPPVASTSSILAGKQRAVLIHLQL